MSLNGASTLRGDSTYASRRREHLELVNKLRALGAEADLDLPRIAVIGNQSAGKSSLVEAISGISVPRDAGTCTRCPIECRMTFREDAWTCKIFIRWEYNQDGTKRDPVEEVPFGSAITNKEEVELALRRAQAALLNPNKSGFENSLEENLRSEANELSFSQNVVCVDLSGPDLVDLAFVDMPGIIQNAENSVVQFVENLVLRHISGNCLILVTLPMSDDIENQKAMSLARQVDPTGARTIGVLTKPDTLTSGAIRVKQTWIDVLEGRDVRFPLQLGYYCTRQPDEDERKDGITNSQARATEVEFFAQTPPWSQTTCSQRFGTPSLVSSLSLLLENIINKSIPSIVEETDRQLENCETRLKQLPPAVSEPMSLVLNLVTQFTGAIGAHVEGRLDCAELVQKSSSAFASFKSSIRSTAPPFLPYANHAEANLSSEAVYPLLEVDKHDNVAYVPGVFIYLEDVRDRINQAFTRELPNNTPYVAKLDLIRGFQGKWDRHIRECVDQVHMFLKTLVKRLVKEKFGSYSMLELKVQRAVEKLITKRYDIAVSLTLTLLKFETTAFTQNDHYLSTSKEKLLALYKGARADRKAPMSNGQAQSNGFAHANSATNVGGLFSGITPAPSASAPAVPSTFAFGFGTPSNSTPPLFSPATKTQAGNAATVNMTSSAPNPAASFFAGFSAPQGKPPPSTGAPVQSSQLSSTTTPSTPSNQAFVPITRPAAAPTSVLSDEERRRLEAETLSNLTKLGYDGIVSRDLGRLRPDDEYQRELEVMAEVRAYFKVAYKRMIDNIPLAIDHEFLRGFGEELQPHLFKELGLTAPDAATKCKAYLAEDPMIVATREELLARQRRLWNVKEELVAFDI